MSFVRSLMSCLVATFALALAAPPAHAQARMEREGVVLYWGLIPAAIASQRFDVEDTHGTPEPGGGKRHHLVVALFRTDGTRIENAVVRAQLKEVGINDAPPKYLTPMTINGQASYGQVFTSVLSGRVYFRVWVKLPDRPSEIEYRISAEPPHAGGQQ